MDPILCMLFAFLLHCSDGPAATPPPPSAITSTAQPLPEATGTPMPRLPTSVPTATPTPTPARRLTLPPPEQADEIAFGDRNAKQIALTFDAGIRSPSIVPILDQLRAANVRSTMFLTGWWADQYPDLVARMVREGHEMANHSYNHPDFPDLTAAQMAEEIRLADEAITSHGGVSTKPWFRPPSGARDARVNRTVAGLGYYSIYWSLDAWDWMEEVTAQEVLERTVTKARGGDIIVMHLTSPQTAAVLTDVIAGLRARGFEIVTVSGLFSE